MSMNAPKKPWGRVFAVVPDPRDDTKHEWFEIGAAWLNEKDGKTSLRFTVKGEPAAWRDPLCQRVIEIQKSQPRRDDR